MCDDEILLSSRFQFSYHVHDYLCSQIKLIDSKSKIALAVISALLVYVFQYPNNEDVVLSYLQSSIWFSILLFYIISAFYSLRSIYPQLSGAMDGLVYFEAIAGKKQRGIYLDRIESLDCSAILREISNHNFELSVILVNKTRRLNRAFFFGILGFMSMLAFIQIIGFGIESS